MQLTRTWFLCLFVVIAGACAASPDINVGNEPDGSVAGNGGTAGSAGFGGVGGAGGGDNALTAKVTEPPSEMAIEVITVSCAGECKQVLAIASGGNAPYTFAWNDGVTNDSREICGNDDTTFSVTVTDTAFDDPEFNYEAQQSTAAVTMQVLACPTDAGVEDAGVDAGTCGDASSASVIGELTPDLIGTPAYFADGATLPAGRYRITYVDGCMKYEGPWPWTVNGFAGSYEFRVIGDTTSASFGIAPGTATSFYGAVGGYQAFDECVAANLALPPFELMFGGGRLGIWNSDFKVDDNSPGPDGRSPTWRLTRVCE